MSRLPGRVLAVLASALLHHTLNSARMAEVKRAGTCAVDIRNFLCSRLGVDASTPLPTPARFAEAFPLLLQDVHVDTPLTH